VFALNRRQRPSQIRARIALRAAGRDGVAENLTGRSTAAMRGIERTPRFDASKDLEQLVCFDGRDGP
jgi:hypothetical protein